MKNLFLLIGLIASLKVDAQIGWYLKVNGTMWDQSSAIPNNATLIFGMKEGTNLTPCYNLTTAKLSQGTSILAQPTGLKNPWNINLIDILKGKTGLITLEIYGTGCTGTSTQHWIINFNATAAAGSSTTTTSPTSGTTAPAGTTAASSILKTAPRTQHILAKVHFVNKTGTVNKVCFTTGYPVTGSYQTISNLKINSGVVKTTPTGCKYLEFTYASVAKGASVDAIYEYDVTTYSIEMNISKAVSKAYASNADFTNFTRSVPIETDLTNTKLKSICDNLWAASSGNFITYAQKVAAWMSNNTEWKFTGGIVSGNTFFNEYTAGVKCQGDCGSLSNAMVAMLRYKGIPARLLIGYGAEKITATDYKAHAWLEFHVQDYGWIPVDPSYRTSGQIIPGKIPHKGIIVSHDAFYDLTMIGSTFKNMFMQTYLWALSGTAPADSYTLNFTIASSNFSE
jgi:hypothetical protein